MSAVFEAEVLRVWGDHTDGAHDVWHLRRVWALAQQIAAVEGGGTGLGGAVLIAADIPLLFGINCDTENTCCSFIKRFYFFFGKIFT